MSAPRSARILAIDDSMTIRKLLEMTLSGYNLEIAVNGGDGLMRAQRRPPHLILLDFVLPDMEGIAVCHSLAKDELTRKVPIIIMSAKSDDLKELFKDIPSVIGFVGKPFTPPEIRFHVEQALERYRPSETTILAGPRSSTRTIEKPTEPAADVQFTFTQREAGAKAIFNNLWERFDKIPEWSAKIGAERPALFYAQRILTPELMEGMLKALTPVYKEALSKLPSKGAPDDAASAQGGSADGPAPTLNGQLGFMSIPNLLKLILTGGRSGVLILDQSARKTQVFIRRGEIVLVSHNEPDEYARRSHIELESLAHEDLKRAEDEQLKSGKPLFVTLAEDGKIPADKLAAVLHELGERAILDAIEAGPGSFQFFEKQLPPYVEAYAQGFSLEQLNLQRLRKVDDWAQIELHVNSLEQVWERCEFFSHRLRNFELADAEKRVLTLVNRRNSVKQIIERTGLTTFQVFQVLFCLNQAGLIRRPGQPTGSTAVGIAPAPATSEVRPVMIIEPDVESIQEPLSRLLARRRVHPIPLINLNDEAHPIERILKERPQLLLVNPRAPGLDLARLVTDVRAHIESSDLSITALLDLPHPDGRALGDADIDAVLVKPFHFKDLLRLLAA